MTVDYLSTLNQGGSGLNVTQIVDSLVEAEQAPKENQIQSKIDTKNTAISAIGEIKSALSKLSTSIKSLTGNTSLNVSSTSSAISATISDPSTAVAINSSISINEKNISKGLYTKNIPDPEILIRTGDRHRLSNFLLWQVSYSEIFFVKKLWPDFTKKDFRKILIKFKRMRRNFGGLK